MVRLEEKILLGVTGGIAAYKAAILVRRLREAGAEVRVVMTAAARAFITPLTLQAVSGQPVRSELFDPHAEAGMGHIELARWPERILIAPATADFMARLAHGLADDLLTTLCLATTAPLVLAPAMNASMWLHPATQANAELLRQRGVRLLGPAVGEQACGDHGPGRMLEPEALVTALKPAPGAHNLSGVMALITAGPTQEPLDPVRFISNRSSGRMGYAVAQALNELGATVCLVSGPVHLTPPPGMELISVATALEMRQAVANRVESCHLFVATAAVADYRVERPAVEKLKKVADQLTLRLVKNPDILAEVAARPQRPFCVGFAAETERLEEQALEKLRRKRLDLIAANQVGAATGGFEREDNALLVLWEGGQQRLPLQPKLALARQLAALIAQRYHSERR